MVGEITKLRYIIFIGMEKEQVPMFMLVSTWFMKVFILETSFSKFSLFLIKCG